VPGPFSYFPTRPPFGFTTARTWFSRNFGDPCSDEYSSRSLNADERASKLGARAQVWRVPLDDFRRSGYPQHLRVVHKGHTRCSRCVRPRLRPQPGCSSAGTSSSASSPKQTPPSPPAYPNSRRPLISSHTTPLRRTRRSRRGQSPARVPEALRSPQSGARGGGGCLGVSLSPGRS
jgi:hypothetical protein